MDSDRQIFQQNADQSDITTSDEPTISIGVGAVSGGLAGAAIGRFVGGRLGAAIGAVVGGVAGAAISQTEAAEHAVDTVKDKAAEVKPALTDAVHNVQDKAQEISPAIAHKVGQVQDSLQAQIDAGQSSVNTFASATPSAPTAELQNNQTLIQSPITSVADNTGSAYVSSDVDFDPVSIDEQYEQGIRLGRQGDLVGSIALFQSVIASEPDYAEAHYNLGVVLGKHGLREQGIEHIQQSRDLCKVQGRSQEVENINQILQKLSAE